MKFKALFLLFILTSLTFAQQQRRIVQPVNDGNMVRLAGTIHPRLANATDQGAVSPTMQLHGMRLVFSRSPQQQTALDQLLAEQQDPNSANYHKWLTPEEFGAQFGLAQADIVTLSAWLTAQGFTVDSVARGRDFIVFSGIAAQVEAAFHAPIHNYLVGGKAHFAASTDVSIPGAFSGVVSGVTGLHNFAPKARNIKAQPRVTSSITGNHFIVPGDFATIYNLPSYSAGVPCTGAPPACLNGTGQTIAIVGQSNLSTDSNPGRNGTPGVNGQQYDLVTFRNLAGLPALGTAPTFQIVIVPPYGDPGVAADAAEANLDVEWSGAAAPNANLIFVVENSNNGGDGAFGALVYAVDNNLAPVISVSYGVCEAQLGSSDQTNLTNAGIQANAQGQAIVVASGDSGAADCDINLPATSGLSVDFPGSMPYSTSIGGNSFTGDIANSTAPTQATQYWSGSTNDVAPSALSYIPETAWNDTPPSVVTSCTVSSSNPSCISATGGGVSKLFTKPSWQTGLGVPNDGQRDIPDIAFNASPSHDQTVICSQSSCVVGYRNAVGGTYDVIGGTSLGAPTFTGILALINQDKGSPQGNINPQLYPLAASSPWAFNDITTGNNVVACSSGTGCNGGSMGYSATAGYDLVTGWGSVNVGPFINSLAGTSDFSVTPSTTSLTIPANGSSTLTLSVLGTSGSSINFSNCTALSPLVSVTCSAPTVTATGSTPATSTLTVSNTTSNSETGTVNVVASNGSISHLVPIAVTVSGGAANFTLSVASTAVAISSGGTITDSLTVTAANGFASDVALTCAVPSSLGTTSCSISPAVATGGNGTSLVTITGAVLSRDRGAPLPFNHRGLGEYATVVFALGMVFTAQPTRRRTLKRTLRNGLFGLFLLGVMFGALSCGGGSSGGGSGPTPLNGNVTITGIGGGITNTTTINVTVN